MEPPGTPPVPMTITGTPQAIFDRVVAHLAAQGEPALSNEGVCQYHMADGRRCAVGCLLPTDVDTGLWEGKIITALVECGEVVCDPPSLLPLLQDLQAAHDTPQGTIQARLRNVAARYGLDPVPIAAITRWE